MRGVWPAAGLVVVYLWCFPYFASLRSANEVPRVLVAQQIVRQGTFRIEARRSELGSQFDVAKTPDGRWYSNKAPGVSLLAVPVVYVADLIGVTSMKAQTWLLRVLVISLPCLLFLPWFAGLARRFGEDRLSLVAYALGSMALVYGVLYFSHALAGACAGGAFVAAVRLGRGEARRPWLAAVACGFLAGLSMLVDYQSLLAAAAVGAYLLLRRNWRHIGIALAASLPPVLLLLAYHAACFGSPFRTGYSFAADPAHKQGVLGIVGPNREALANALVTPDNGLLLLTPWVLFAVVGAVVALRDRERRAEAAVCVAVSLVYVLFVGSLVPEFGRAGWSVGPRYIGVAMPFLAWLAAAGFAWAGQRSATWVAAIALVGVAVVIHVVAIATYPHWPTSFRHPLYELSFRALGEGVSAPSLGGWLGLSGVIAVLPVFVVAAALWVWAAGAKRIATLAGAVLVVGVVISYSLLPRTPGGTAKQFTYVRETMTRP